MSYTELHIGKFSIVATGTDEIDAFIKANKLEDKVDRDEYGGEVTYYIDSDEGYEFVFIEDLISIGAWSNTTLFLTFSITISPFSSV